MTSMVGRTRWGRASLAQTFALACLADEPKIRTAFRTGEGFAWGDHDPGVFTGCERFFRPSYVANLVSAWIPAVPGLHEALASGKPAIIHCLIDPEAITPTTTLSAIREAARARS